MLIKDFNKLVSEYQEGLERGRAFADRQAEMLNRIRKEAEVAIRRRIKDFEREMEGIVSDWKISDFNEFLSLAMHDVRLNNVAILTITTAYIKTHEHEKDVIMNKAYVKNLAKQYTGDYVSKLFGCINGEDE